MSQRNPTKKFLNIKINTKLIASQYYDLVYNVKTELNIDNNYVYEKKTEKSMSQMLIHDT